MPGWTDVATVQLALGPSVRFDTDPIAELVVTAACAWAVRKRGEAGYTDDDPNASPGPDVTFGTTLYAVALWRERASTDGFPSFDELQTFTPAGGSSRQINRLLGVGRAQVDGPRTVDRAPMPWPWR